MMINNLESQAPGMLDLFPQTKTKGVRRSDQQKKRLVKRKLREVILGKRPYLKVHSEALQTNFWFVNEGLADPTDKMFTGKVITMEMLAEIMVSNQSTLRSIEEMFREKT